MKTTKMLAILVLALAIMVCVAQVSEAAPMGTVFTYQGRLMDANSPADGVYDFKFRLYQDANGGGFEIVPTVLVDDHDVIDGYFTVDLDFGEYAFNGDARWLEIAVRPGDSNDAHTILNPRQQVTPTPYAMRAHISDSSADGVTGSGTANRLAKFTATKAVGDSAIYENAGKVGIGTTSPESKLHVEQSVGAWGEGIRLSYGDHEWDIVTDYVGERLTIAPDQDSTKGLVIQNGNVGIGTASPEKTLTIQRARPHLALVESGGDAGVVEFHEQENQLRFQYWTGYGSNWNRTMMTLDGDTGNVGIGTDNPSVKLEVVDSNELAVLYCTNNTDAGGCAVYGKGTSGCGIIGISDTSSGVYARSETYTGVHGKSTGGYGVHGESEDGHGVLGESYTANGVHGDSASGYGVYGRSFGSAGIYGESEFGYAGYFNGDVYVEDDCSAESFTDRTPYPKDVAIAYAAVMSMGRLPDGQYDETDREAQLDHATLHDYIRSEDGNRDLSATVSCQNEVLKDVVQRLEEKEQVIKKLHEQNRELQAQLAQIEMKLDAMQNRSF